MANGDRLLYSALDLNGRRVKEVGDPVAPGDAANKAYVDAHAGAGGGGGAAALGDLTDVDVTAYPPGPGDQLVWWPEQQMWVPAPRQRVTNLFPMNVATGTTTAGTVDGFSAKVGNGVIASVTEPRWRDVYRSLQIECTPGMNSPEVEIVPVRFPAGTAKIGYSFYLYAESAGEGQFTSIAGGGVWLDDQGQHVNSVGSGRPVKAADAGTWVRHVWSLTPPPGATQFRPKITVNGLGTTGHPVVFVSGLQVQVGEVTPWVADSGGPAIADASDVVVDEVHAPDGAVLTWSAGAGVWIAAEPAAGGGPEVFGVEPWPRDGWDVSGLQVTVDAAGSARLHGRLVWSGATIEMGGFQTYIGRLPGDVRPPAATLQQAGMPVWPYPDEPGVVWTPSLWLDQSGQLCVDVQGYGDPDSKTIMDGYFDVELVWSPKQKFGVADLADVQVGGVGYGKALVWDGSRWVGMDPVMPLSSLSDAQSSTADGHMPSDGQVLTWSAEWNTWAAANPPAGGGGYPLVVQDVDPAYDNSEMFVFPHADGWEVFGKVTMTDPSAFKANPAGTWILTGRLPAGIDYPAEDVVATILKMGPMVQIDAKLTTTGEVYTAYIKGNSMAIAASASVQRGLFVWGQTDTGGGVSGPTITAQGDATQSSGRLEVQDAGAAYPTWHVYSEGPKTVMGWGDGTSAPSYQIGFQLAEYGDTVVTGSNLRTQRALELQTPSDWTIHRLEATPETVTLDGSPIMTEAALASLVDEVAALKAEVQVLRSRLGDGA